MKFNGPAFAIGAISGATLGGIVGFLLCRHLGEIRFEERLEAELAAADKHYRARLARDTQRLSDSRYNEGYLAAFAATTDDDGGRTTITSDVPPSVLSPGSDASVGTVIKRMVDYGAISSGLKAQPKWLEAPPDDRPPMPVDVVPPVPQVITLAQFCEDNDKYQKLAFTYYAEDKILAGEDDQPVEDPIGLVGPALESKFGLSEPTEPNTVYVRNDRLEIDFEITRHLGSYATIVAGLEYGGLASERPDEQDTN